MPTAEKKVPAAASSARVLIVDQDAEFAATLSQNLREWGKFEVEIAADADGALERLRNQVFHVVVSDLELAGEHQGLQLAHEIRKEQIVRPEIVLLSKDPSKVSVFEAHQVGACHVLKKPVNVQLLCTLVTQSRGEVRRYERIHIDPKSMGEVYGEIRRAQGKKDPYKVEISNLGRGGFFYRSDDDKRLPAIGQIVDFQIKLGMVPDYVFEGKGIIRWHRDELDLRGAGVEFLQIPEDSERLITAFVDLFRVREFVPAT